jgi:hypothetical protein
LLEGLFTTSSGHISAILLTPTFEPTEVHLHALTEHKLSIEQRVQLRKKNKGTSYPIPGFYLGILRTSPSAGNCPAASIYEIGKANAQIGRSSRKSKFQRTPVCFHFNICYILSVKLLLPRTSTSLTINPIPHGNLKLFPHLGSISNAVLQTSCHRFEPKFRLAATQLCSQT